MQMRKTQRRQVPKVPSHLSVECQDLLVRMLCEDPNRRITTAQIQQHPWFTQGPPVGLKAAYHYMTL